MLKIGIVGLGLIGGSIAKAIQEYTDHTVLGMDRDEGVQWKAKLIGAIDDRLTLENLSSCDFVIIALYPADTVAFIQEHAHRFSKDTLVMDTSGVKRFVMDEVVPFAEREGFRFIGAHPMAGVEHSGFAHAQKTLFRNASLILTPPPGLSIKTLETAKLFWLSIGFGNVEITTPDRHDRMIAFTSQMAHVVSSAYVKSPRAEEHKGFSAGSYKDLTRVAKLNPTMWSELFQLNKDHLTEELDELIHRLTLYREAIATDDTEVLRNLLDEGAQRKIALDHGTRKR